MSIEPLKFEVNQQQAGQILRLFLSDAMALEPEAFVRQLITAGRVTVDGETSDPRRVLQAGQTVTVEGIAEERQEAELEVVRSPVIYEDENIIALNKPAGCTVVRERHTDLCAFQHGVLEYLRKSPDAERVRASRYRPRAVHRLDRDTTGVVLCAKTREGELHLFRQFQERTVAKEYLAVLRGELPASEGIIEAGIAERPQDLARMDVSDEGKPSETRWKIEERFRDFTLVRAFPKTGRRHQVRIHFAHIGCPIVADKTYGGGDSVMLSDLKRKYHLKPGQPEKPLISRPALHAQALTFIPVGTDEPIRLEAPLPKDMEVLLKMLRKYRS